MNAAVIMSAGTMPSVGATTAMTAVPAMSWEMMFIKVPAELSSDAARPALGPYSLLIMPTSVMQPELRMGFIYSSASMRQPMPPPRVNHHALMP